MYQIFLKEKCHESMNFIFDFYFFYKFDESIIKFVSFIINLYRIYINLQI